MAQIPTQTLDQQRAALAWGYATSNMAQPHGKDYKNLAKGAPALIMTSGLMPTLAFYHGKGGVHQQLLDDLIRGISERLPDKTAATGPDSQLFSRFMLKLQRCDSQDYMRATDEALELLKWLRNFVDALKPEDAKK